MGKRKTKLERKAKAELESKQTHADRRGHFIMMETTFTRILTDYSLEL